MSTREDLFGISDLYGVSEALTEAELAPLARLQKVLDDVAKPVINEHWEAGTFPEEVVDPIQDLRLIDPEEFRGDGKPHGLYHGLRKFVLARTDASLATWHTAQAGLFRTAVRIGSSPEQWAEWEPKIDQYQELGVFALTEPDHGSDIAGGLATSATREGDTWVINGAKRWIGGASSADRLCVFARDTEDGQVKAFLVPRRADGVTLEKIERKTALRIMQNAHITLENVRVPEADRLQECNSFKDVSNMLRVSRSDVAWIATGLQAGAYEAARKYVMDREQFGRPLTKFQLVSEKLALAFSNVTASLQMVANLTKRQDEGIFRDEESSMAKLFICDRMRETVALCREICGGNGITLDTDVARFHADAQAVYSYEGTHEVNALIVARHATGVGAFV
jgi:glutaryl-CoA dehydrogenase